MKNSPPPQPETTSITQAAEQPYPERRCIVTGESGPRTLLIRFARAPDGTVVPDLAEKLPGRGLWVRANALLLQQAITKKLFSKAARQACITPPDLVMQTEVLLKNRVLDSLGLAKKSGLVVLGETAVHEAARAGTLGALLIATDASPRAAAEFVAHHAILCQLPPAAGLTASLLGSALGRDNAVYIGITKGKLAQSLFRDCLRLAEFVTPMPTESKNDD